VCDVLNSWLVMHEVQQDLVIAQGASLGIAGAVFCATIWTVFRRALGAKPLVSVLSRFMLRAAGGALCGVGVAALMTLFALHGFHAATIEQLADQAFLSWARAVPWVSAACAVLFVLSAVPGVSTGRGMLAQLSRVASPWQKQ